MRDEASLNQNTQELTRLLLKNRDMILAYTLAMVRDWNTAEDLFQEVSLVVLEKARTGILVNNFGAWSREIARRTVLSHWKKRKKDPIMLSEDVLEVIERSFARHDSDTESKSLSETLQRCMRKLPEQLRQLINLRYQDNLSVEQLSKRLSRSMVAVQKSLSRVRIRLLECTNRLLVRER